jgi:hypothetical protein
LGKEYADKTEEDDVTQVALLKDVTIQQEVSIPFGVTLDVPKGKTITLADNGKLAVAGTLEVNGTLKREGGGTITTGEGGIGTIMAEDEASLMAALGGAALDTPVAVEIKNTTVLQGTDEIPEGATLAVPAGKTLFVAGTLTVKGTLAIETDGRLIRTSQLAVITTEENGTIAVRDAANLEDALLIGKSENTVVVELKNDVGLRDTTVVPEGATLVVPAGVTLAVPAGKTLSVTGTVKVTGTLKVPALGQDGLPKDGTVAFADDGAVELSYGAKGYYGENLFISPDDDGVYQWDNTDTNSTVTLKGGNVMELTKGKITAIQNTEIAAQTEIVIAENAALTIADGVTFTVGGAIVGADSGSTIVNSGTITVTGASNFYPQDDTNAEDSPSAASYTWATTAGGENTAGWKAAAP